jgi:predicted solute-binding protein
VNYLNSKPLIEGLAEALPQADLQLDFPSRLADRLLAGTLDVALVPSIASLLSPRFEVVSDACVATRGPVLSVKLYSRVRPAEIGTLALDVRGPARRWCGFCWPSGMGSSPSSSHCHSTRRWSRARPTPCC